MAATPESAGPSVIDRVRTQETLFGLDTFEEALAWMKSDTDTANQHYQGVFAISNLILNKRKSEPAILVQSTHIYTSSRACHIPSSPGGTFDRVVALH